jgi:hypothetical protein
LVSIFSFASDPDVGYKSKQSRRATYSLPPYLPIHFVVAADVEKDNLLLFAVGREDEPDFLSDPCRPKAVQLSMESVKPEMRMVRVGFEKLKSDTDWAGETWIAFEETAGGSDEGLCSPQAPHQDISSSML